MMNQTTPCARLCHIIKWDDFDGYGFNLHAEKGKNGQFIGKVDEGSPSEAAGLRQGDRIIEVNEINIANETHKQVVERIKAFPTETKLLVVDQQADDYFKANNIPIKGSMPGIKVIKTPEKSPLDEPDYETTAATSPMVTTNSSSNSNNMSSTPKRHSLQGTNGHQTSGDTHSIGSSNDGGNHHRPENGNGSAVTRLDDDYPDTASNKSSSSAGKDSGIAPANGSASSGGSLNLTMSAKELRAKLAQRKKYDPKKESMGFKDKFDIVQKL